MSAQKRSSSTPIGGEDDDAQSKRRKTLSGAKPPSRPPVTKAESQRDSIQSVFAAAKKAGTALQKQEKGHPPHTYSVQLHQDFAKLRTLWLPEAPNETKAGPLGEQDYAAGYLSDEGERFLKQVHSHKNEEIAKASTLETSSQVSRSQREIKTGQPTSATYYGTPIDFRVDYTQDKSKTWEPHVRIFVGKNDASTKELATVASGVSTFKDTEQTHFVKGLQGRSAPDPVSAEYGLGVQLRAVARASDAFGKLYPAIDGYLMSRANTPEKVSHLFQHPEFGTGALGSQNAGVQATAEFQGFHEIMSPRTKSHTTQLGTDIESVPAIRKAKAINAFAPPGREIVTITKQVQAKQKT